MELATCGRGSRPGGLTMAGIPYVFTITHVAKMLGEDEAWLREVSVNKGTSAPRAEELKHVIPAALTGALCGVEAGKCGTCIRLTGLSSTQIAC